MVGSSDGLFRIGEVVKRSGFSRRQIHNFIGMGLIKEESRTAGGHFLFNREIYRRLSIIRGLRAKDYPLTEIRRTWKALLRLVLITFSLLGAFTGAENLSARAAEEWAPSSQDLTEIRALLNSVRQMVLKEKPAMIAGMLAPGTRRRDRQKITSGVRGDLESYKYVSFEWSFNDQDLEVLDTERLRVDVLIRCQYKDRSRDGVVLQGDDQYWGFDFVKAAGSWRIAGSDYLDSLNASHDQLLGGFFMIAVIVLVLGSFWGWMFLDCCFRIWPGHKGVWLLLLGLSLLGGGGAAVSLLWKSTEWALWPAFLPGVTSVMYFFAVWMRQSAED